LFLALLSDYYFSSLSLLATTSIAAPTTLKGTFATSMATSVAAPTTVPTHPDRVTQLNNKTGIITCFKFIESPWYFSLNVRFLRRIQAKCVRHFEEVEPMSNSIPYQPQEIESQTQEYWAKHSFKVTEDPNKEKFYC